MAKMIDVARATNLSLSTVSEILSGKPGYNEETRALVREAAQRLNYTPNPISRALSGGRSMSIGLFVTSKATTYTVACRVEAIVQEAAGAGYHAYIVYATGDQHKFEEECLTFAKDMISRRVDGMIFHGRIAPKAVNFLAKQKLPIIYIDSRFPESDSALEINRANGIGQAARHLYELGHREVAVAQAPRLASKDFPGSSIHQEQLSAAGLKMLTAPEWMPLMDATASSEFYESYVQAARRGNLPTALMLNNDEAAFLAISALREAGYRVPQDISLIGFDDLPLARHYHPALTTISVPSAPVGKKAFQCLAARIDRTPEGAAVPSPFNTELIIRETTARARS